MKLRKTVQRMLRMRPLAWYIFIRSLQLSCALLFGAILLLLRWDGDMQRYYTLYMTALALNETAQSVLLLGVLLPVVVEDLQS